MRPMAVLTSLLVLGCRAGPSGGDAGLGAADAGPPSCLASEGAFPRRLRLPHPDPNGEYDPALARDPDGGRLWMAYSGVDGPAGAGRISTYLAYSDDEGATWCDAGVINRAEAVPRDQQPAAIAQDQAHWSHETPALAYDPAAPPAARWILMWHRYLHVDDGVPGNEDRHFEHGWLAVRRAASPAALAGAQERKLFTTRAYHADPNVEAYNDAAPGGAPEMRWDGDPMLGACLVFAEPGSLAWSGELFVAMLCFVTADDRRVVLVGHDGAAWTYRGTLLTTDDTVPDVGPHHGFNGAALVLDDSGDARLLVSPARASGGYLGCVAYDVDLAASAITSEPTVVAPFDDAAFQSGPCSYAPHSPLGVVTGDTYLSGVQFQLFATGTPLE